MSVLTKSARGVFPFPVMFRRLLIQSTSHRQLLRSAAIVKQKSKLSSLLATSLIPTMSANIIPAASSSSFSTTTPVMRGKQYLSKIENYDSSTYKTLAFYKFHEFTKPELDALRIQLLTDLGELGIVGRIYISKEGLNAQIACPEECLSKLQEYHANVLKPMFNGNLMDLNIGTEHGKRSFRALHVRIRKAVRTYTPLTRKESLD